MPALTASATPVKPKANPSHCSFPTGSPKASPMRAVAIGIMPVTRAIRPMLTPRAAAK